MYYFIDFLNILFFITTINNIKLHHQLFIRNINYLFIHYCLNIIVTINGSCI